MIWAPARQISYTDARLWHSWLRINRVLRVMLHTHWSAEAWLIVRVEFRRALALRSETVASKIVTSPDGEPLTFHGLRHHFASQFVMRGGSIQALSKILGHATLAMTMRYSHLSQEHLRDEITMTDRRQLLSTPAAHEVVESVATSGTPRKAGVAQWQSS